MSHRMSCRRLIPAFLLTLALCLPSVAAAAAAPDGTADRGRAVLALESLWRWLGLVGGPPSATTAPETGGGGTPSGGESQGSQDPNGGGTPPPEYDPDLNPGGG